MRNIGETVTLNGKNYTITGFHKRSYLLKGENTLTYKISPAKLERMLNGTPRVTRPRAPSDPNAVPTYLLRMIQLNNLFAKRPDVAAKLPETEDEIMAAFSQLSGDLSPENLCCDGELSQSAVRQKHSEIMKAWHWLERKLGRSMTEDEAYAWYSRNHVSRRTDNHND